MEVGKIENRVSLLLVVLADQAVFDTAAALMD